MQTSVERNEPLMVAVFGMGETRLGMDAEGIDEITALPAVTPVRGAPDWVVGIGNLRNRIITIIDLGRRLGFGETAIGPQTRLVMSTFTGEPVGVLVPQLPDIVQVDRGAVRPVINEIEDSIRQYFAGVLEQEDRLVALLDTGRVLAAQAGGGAAQSGAAGGR